MGQILDMGLIIKMLGLSILIGGLYGSTLVGQHGATKSLSSLIDYTYNPKHISGNDPTSQALRTDLEEIKASLPAR